MRLGLQVVEVYAGGGLQHHPLPGPAGGEGGVLGVGVEYQARGGMTLRQGPPQLGDGRIDVPPAVRERAVLEYAVQACVERPLPPALHVGQELAEAVRVAVLGRDGVRPCG